MFFTVYEGFSLPENHFMSRENQLDQSTFENNFFDENKKEIDSNKPKATTEHQRFSAPVPRPWILLACTALVDLARCNFAGSNATQESQVINLCYTAPILYHVSSCFFRYQTAVCNQAATQIQTASGSVEAKWHTLLQECNSLIVWRGGELAEWNQNAPKYKYTTNTIRGSIIISEFCFF